MKKTNSNQEKQEDQEFPILGLPTVLLPSNVPFFIMVVSLLRWTWPSHINLLLFITDKIFNICLSFLIFLILQIYPSLTGPKILWVMGHKILISPNFWSVSKPIKDPPLPSTTNNVAVVELRWWVIGVENLPNTERWDWDWYGKDSFGFLERNVLFQ